MRIFEIIFIDGEKVKECGCYRYVDVTFTGLEIFVYWSNGQPQVGAKATGISLVNNKA